jgi:hypothetical protein
VEAFFAFHKHCFLQYLDRLCFGAKTDPQTSHGMGGRLVEAGMGLQSFLRFKNIYTEFSLKGQA